MTTENLLKELQEERIKFSKADQEKMLKIIEALLEAGIYPKTTPTMEKYGYTHQNMVQYWGAWWHIYSEPHCCPHCLADLRDHESGPPGKRELLHKPKDDLICPDCQEIVGNLYNTIN